MVILTELASFLGYQFIHLCQWTQKRLARLWDMHIDHQEVYPSRNLAAAFMGSWAVIFDLFER